MHSDNNFSHSYAQKVQYFIVKADKKFQFRKKTSKNFIDTNDTHAFIRNIRQLKMDYSPQKR